MGSIYIFLVASDSELLFMCAFAIHISSVELLTQSFCRLLKTRLFVFLLLHFKCARSKSLIKHNLLIFFLDYDLSLLTCLLKSIFKFWWNRFINFSFYGSFSQYLYLKNLSLIQTHIFNNIFFKNFYSLGSAFKSMIHFELIFVYHMTHWLKFTVSYMNNFILATFVETTIFFL